MDEFDKDFLKQTGQADQLAAKLLKHLEKIRNKQGVERWIGYLAYLVASYDDVVYGTEAREAGGGHATIKTCSGGSTQRPSLK